MIVIKFWKIPDFLDIWEIQVKLFDVTQTFKFWYVFEQKQNKTHKTFWCFKNNFLIVEVDKGAKDIKKSIFG